MFLAESFTSKA